MPASAPPNVVGYPLDEARAVLAQAGWDDVETMETQPPRRGLIGPYRVLRQRIAGGRVALVVSGERSERSERSEHSERSERSERSEHSEHSEHTAAAVAEPGQGNDVASEDPRT